MKTIKVRIEPNAEQRHSIDIQIDANRIVYNGMITACKLKYEKDAKLPSVFDLNKIGTRMRKNSPYIASAYSMTLNETSKRVISSAKKTMDNEKKRSGELDLERFDFDIAPKYPRYRSKSQFSSYTYPSTRDYSLTEVKIKGKTKRRLRLGKVPGEIRCYNNRTKLNGVPKTCTIVRKDMGTYSLYYACISYEPYPEEIVKADKGPIGIDVGVKNIAALSDGTIFPNDHAFERHRRKLAKEQRRMSRHTPGTREHKLSMARVNHIHEKIKNRRRNNTENISAYIVKHHDPIAMEDLSVRGLRHISMDRRMTNGYNDASPGMLRRRIQDKAESAGREIILIDPKGTSQECSDCGAIIKKRLSDRTHSCKYCGLTIDRDVNAAKVILKRALSLQSPMGSAGDPVSG